MKIEKLISAAPVLQQLVFAPLPAPEALKIYKVVNELNPLLVELQQAAEAGETQNLNQEISTTLQLPVRLQPLPSLILTANDIKCLEEIITWEDTDI